jgi:large subunit ribosomal protein L25
MTILNGKNRNTKDSLDTLRAEGLLPAVFYGAGNESTPVSIDSKEFEKAYDEVGGSQALSLEVEGKKLDVLVHEVSRHPISNTPVHVDFLVIDTNKPIEVAVSLEFVGASEAERTGGIITKTLHEVEVKALPADIPDNIEVDLSLLENVDSVIHLKDLKIPAKVELVNDPEKVVASVTVAKEEVEPEAGEADDAMANIEVEKKGKEESDSEEK